MIPIVSVANLVSAFTFSCITVKLYFSYRKNKTERLGDFLKSFLFMTISLLFLALPGLIITDLRVLGFVFAIYPFFIILALSYFGIIPLKLIGWIKMKRVFFWMAMAVNLSFIVVNLLNLQPAAIYYRESFIIFQDARGDAINNLLGAVLGVGILLIIIFFIIQGLKSSERYIRLRAFLISAGLSSLLISSSVNFIFAATEQAEIQAYIISQLLVVSFVNLGAILMMLGVYYKPKNYAESDR